MTNRDVEYFRPPQELEVETPNTDDPPIDAPYDIHSQEAWTTLSGMLEHRLGKYVSRRGFNTHYLAAPAGSRYPGFQEEFPADFYKSATGDSLALNLVAKGIFMNTSTPVWSHTVLGLALRRVDDGQMQLFEENLCRVTQPYGHHDYDLFTTGGRFMNTAESTRAIRYIRMARKLLYLPDILDYQQSKNQHDAR